MDPYSILAGLGGIFWIILLVLAVLTPLMIYLIQRNTHQTRQELRKLNQQLSNIADQLKERQRPPAEKQPTIEEKPTDTISMTCEHCGKSFRYGSKHSGKYKQCPGCKKPILLK